MLKILFFICVSIILLFGFHKIATSATIPAISPKLSVVKTSTLFDRIALCESGKNLHAKNVNSTASGEFQFLWSSWNHYGKELWGDDFYSKNIWSSDNRELAWYIFNKYGTHDWDASKSCWSSPVDG